MPVEYFFPTPIYYSFVTNLGSIHHEVDSYITSVKDIELINPWGDTVQTTFKYGHYNHVLDNTPILLSEIKEHCQNFLIAMKHQVDSIDIKESWCNISNKDSFQHFHIHGDTDLSGVYYHQTTSKDGDIVFRNPSLVNRFHKLTYDIDNSVKYKPEIGKIILFPSFLEHAVFHNTSDDKRISISFNINVNLK
jgi:uncharacterized protein (TIGR02466 family)